MKWTAGWRWQVYLTFVLSSHFNSRANYRAQEGWWIYCRNWHKDFKIQNFKFQNANPVQGRGRRQLNWIIVINRLLSPLRNIGKWQTTSLTMRLHMPWISNWYIGLHFPKVYSSWMVNPFPLVSHFRTLASLGVGTDHIGHSISDFRGDEVPGCEKGDWNWKAKINPFRVFVPWHAHSIHNSNPLTTMRLCIWKISG